MNVRLPAATLFAFSTLQAIWVFPVLLCVLFMLAASVVFLPGLRGRFLWRLPAFKEATISRIAASLTLLLKNGVNLPDAIGLVEQLETSTAATADLRQWQGKLAAGIAALCLGGGQRGRRPDRRVQSRGGDLSLARDLPHRNCALFRAAGCLVVSRCGCFVAGVFGHQHVFASHRHAEQHEWWRLIRLDIT